MSPYQRLHVISSAGWVAKDLAAAGVLPVEGSLGLDAPRLDGSTALWCSGSYAMRLMKSGINHPFLSAGPHWLSRVPAEFLRRRVWSGTIGDMPYQGPVETFYKLAEHKHGEIPALVRTGRSQFQAMAIAAMGPDSGILDGHFVGSEPVHYVREYRCFVAHGRVTAASFYKATLPGIGNSEVEITWNAYESEEDPRLPASGVAALFAQAVVDAMGDDQPPGYSIDVGTDQNGDFSVIEANAAWSSNIYHADRAGVLESILASQQPGYDQWLWKPDTAFLTRARPLPNA